MKMRSMIASFALLMDERLRSNDHKNDTRDHSTEAMLTRLDEEVAAFKAAVRANLLGDQQAIFEVASQGADIANFIVMIGRGLLAAPVLTMDEIEIADDQQLRLEAAAIVEGFARLEREASRVYPNSDLVARFNRRADIFLLAAQYIKRSESDIEL